MRETGVQRGIPVIAGTRVPVKSVVQIAWSAGGRTQLQQGNVPEGFTEFELRMALGTE